MTYKKIGTKYIIRIFKEERIIETLTDFCNKQRIQSGVFHGLGAVREAEFGYYDLSKKEYFFTNYKKDMEVVSMTGNIALLEENPFIHMHALFSDTDNHVLGGHVKEATVGVTIEVHLTHYDTQLQRVYDEEIGLNLLQL
jgi:uncharacterized protein